MTHSKAAPCQFVHNIPHAHVVCAQLDLARQIKQHIRVLPQLTQSLLKPIKVRLQILHTIQQPSVGPEPMRRHDVLQCDQLRDVDGAGVGQRVVRRVEIHDGDGPVERGEELVFAVTVCRFAAAGGTADDLAEWHCSESARHSRDR
jgi:hypothetical protein